MSFTNGFDKQASILATRGRKQISEGNFALPGRRYPIHDAAHARNALARVAQNGSPEEQAKVRAAVHAKYPGIDRELKKEAGNGPLSKLLRRAGQDTAGVRSQVRKEILKQRRALRAGKPGSPISLFTGQGNADIATVDVRKHGLPKITG